MLAGKLPLKRRYMSQNLHDSPFGQRKWQETKSYCNCLQKLRRARLQFSGNLRSGCTYMEWHNVIDAASPELDKLAERYHLHPLHIEDCRQRLENAKIEDGENYIFTVVKCIELIDDSNFDAHDIDLFLGNDFLLTVVEPDDKDTRQH